ncbi:MAG: TonB-dependent receptor domain-containing protein [Gammaproteobacteria bacterium]
MPAHRFIVAALIAAPCLAQEQVAPEAATQLETVVVTAAGRETPARDALAALVVITREEIERAQATDIAELLRLHAGVEVGRNGGPGAVTSVFIRGGESTHTLVLVDGIRINPSSSGGAALQNISPDAIERIEIVKGPRATLYGSDAIAGVINIITRAPAVPAAEVRGRAGSFGTRDASLFAAAGDGASGVALQAQHIKSDGFPPQPALTQDRGFRNSTASVRATTRSGEVSFGAQAWLAGGTSEYTGFFGPADQDFRNQVLAVDASATPLPAWALHLGLSRMLDEVTQNQSADFVRTERFALDWSNVIALGAGSHLSLGTWLAREEVRAALFGSAVAEDRDVASAFVQYEVAAGPHRALAALSAADHDAFGTRTDWNAEYGFDLSARTRLVAAAGTGFRAPDATDRFGFGGNPDLEPERARNYEAGVRYEIAPRHGAELRLFRASVDDLVSVECVGNCFDADPFNDVFMAVNVDEYRNRGAELSWRLDAGGWSANASLLVQEPRSAARPDPCSGTQRLCRRADESAAAGVLRRWNRYSLGLDALAVGERVDFAGAPLAGYALLNLTAGAELGKFQVGARIENLLDRDYQTAAGFSQAGRSAYLTLGWRR